MFGTLNNPSASYQSVSVDAAIASANPHQLILLLFDGAMASLVAAGGQMARKEIDTKGLSISKAIDIIRNGLMASLDQEAGGELAERLDALYEYMCNRLLYANLKNDEKALEEVRNLLNELRDAWATIGPEINQGKTP